MKWPKIHCANFIQPRSALHAHQMLLSASISGGVSGVSSSDIQRQLSGNEVYAMHDMASDRNNYFGLISGIDVWSFYECLA